jgi:hypothetical protein
MVSAQEILEILSKIFGAKEFPTNFDTEIWVKMLFGIAL